MEEKKLEFKKIISKMFEEIFLPFNVDNFKDAPMWVHALINYIRLHTPADRLTGQKNFHALHGALFFFLKNPEVKTAKEDLEEAIKKISEMKIFHTFLEVFLSPPEKRPAVLPYIQANYEHAESLRTYILNYDERDTRMRYEGSLENFLECIHRIDAEHLFPSL